MSHIATIELKVKDLVALKTAAKSLGLEFKEGQRTYRWYGTSVGDYPLPEGFSKDDLGKCDHVISVPGNDRAYEIGVVKSKTSPAEWVLLWDFWQGGFGLQEKVGENANKLKQAYAVEAAKRAAQRAGHRFLGQTQKADGSITLRISPGSGGRGSFKWTP